ncbi:hypothetical protein A3D62_03120 [Candidatus Kaiserbacteria bacterium RIFCSPHIGHO2_02_FULL_49_11]|uniref:Trigger factor n=1 Tax=Candidatus Kaiserbacteria bacterium RIFCSPHIGHO2_02_FULL_49_11 TaxID=1798489 RepID=A0A1F6D0Q9_9BACT|nr:MAG: hypothetical protein A3D62_03120 [Candidatus Kaiserbacteria bacterium RIFCSPHIGHO2_02_FULL_49_11]
MSDKKYENIAIERKEHSEVEIVGEIPAGLIPAYKDRAIKELGQDITLPGFRKGHVPEKVLVQHIGEGRILEEAAELALQDAYPEIIEDNNLHPIGRPQVLITKLAPSNPIGFKINTSVVPEVLLPDYFATVKAMPTKEEVEVTDADVEAVLLQVRRGRARYEKAKERAESGSPTDALPEIPEENDEPLPELDDAFVQTLGNFKTVDDFKLQVRDDVRKDKEGRAREKKRVQISEALIATSSIDLPNILIESELDKMMAQMEDDVLRVNMKFDDYLSHAKKTRDDLRTEWRDQAAKRAKLQLILNEIARREVIRADHDEVHRQMDSILKQYKDASPENVHIFVETQLQNEAVFTFLEEQK